MNTSLDKRRAALKAIAGQHGLSDMTIARIEAINEDEAHRNAKDDPDARPSTQAELAAAKLRRKRAPSSGKVVESATRLIGK